ncbi:fimbrial usher protein StbD [Salmonella enterica subsp. arizonae]|uniref:Fimbrial usher protein StbD n=1 Tax=Salmonella enterica subsp. arizonae TaxID=59203 RepID=A0A447R8R6_SALER|nr:fimbrial usher protein StbD [Salmonella enterica subsp. arizonae]
MFITSLFVSAGTWSSCIKVIDKSALSDAAIKAGYTAQNWLGATDTNTGNIGLPTVISISNSEKFQPSGTLLASGIGNFLTAATGTPIPVNRYFTAAIPPMPGKLYEMYSTNGDSAFAGAFFTSEVEGAYYDVERNVAVRMTNLSTGEYYSRFWKERQLTADSWFQDDKYIYIPASAFSNVLYEMFKIDSSQHFVYTNPLDRDT